jgi:hypothetical protein
MEASKSPHDLVFLPASEHPWRRNVRQNANLPEMRQANGLAHG